MVGWGQLEMFLSQARKRGWCFEFRDYNADGCGQPTCNVSSRTTALSMRRYLRRTHQRVFARHLERRLHIKKCFSGAFKGEIG